VLESVCYAVCGFQWKELRDLYFLCNPKIMTYYALSASNCGDSGMMIETDVIIVGAGISGLTAAYRLLRRDSSLRILVLEAKGWKFLLQSVFQ
jgi:hypothetical protein